MNVEIKRLPQPVVEGISFEEMIAQEGVYEVVGYDDRRLIVLHRAFSQGGDIILHLSLASGYLCACSRSHSWGDGTRRFRRVADSFKVEIA